MDIALDIQGGGDLLLDNNSIRLTESTAESAAQDLYHRLQFFRGEWFLDLRQGIPYFRDVFTKGASLRQIESVFRRAINSSPYVVEVVSLSLTLDKPNRQLELDFDARRADGGVTEFRRFVIEV